MPRDARAYLSDIIDSCDAITTAVLGLDLAGYEGSRLVRSSVEREFIIIGEATAALDRVAPEVFDAITRARRIVDFRNQLTHEYPTVDGRYRVGDRRARCAGASPRMRVAHSARHPRGRGELTTASSRRRFAPQLTPSVMR